MLQEPGYGIIVTASADSLSRNAEGNEPVSEVLKSIFFISNLKRIKIFLYRTMSKVSFNRKLYPIVLNSMVGCQSAEPVRCLSGRHNESPASKDPGRDIKFDGRHDVSNNADAISSSFKRIGKSTELVSTGLVSAKMDLYQKFSALRYD